MDKQIRDSESDNSVMEFDINVEIIPKYTTEEMEDAINNSQIIMIFTERKEINDLDDELFERKIVFDGRGILEQSKIKECLYYFSPLIGEIKKR